jgi:type IV secretory pathway VirB2 component (pilin)
MTMLQEIGSELIGMFAGDGQLSLAVIAIVAVAAALIDLTGIEPLAAGGFILIGCLVALIESVFRSARQAAKA